MCPSSILDGNKGESCITNQEACMANEISRRKGGGGREILLKRQNVKFCENSVPKELFIQHSFPKVAPPEFPRRELGCAAGSIIRAPFCY